MQRFLTAALLLIAWRASAAEPVEALLIGGGPDAASNTAQIESHVRFVASLAGNRRVFFADGQADKPGVSGADVTPAGKARTALAVLMPNSGLDAATLAHKPNVGGSISGPADRNAVRKGIGELAGKHAGEPFLVYFAGHGSRDDDGKVTYNLWDNGDLSVPDLVGELARVPAKTPVVLIMAQCYSGAFSDVLFRKGDPKGELAPQNLVGFFSAHRDRTAAGCGTQTDAADFQDFSAYFFGALGGRDPFGKPVTGADADGDGRVSLHEAFCWAMGHDESFDTPVCTSDAFLERFGATADETIFSEPFSKIVEAASPGQRAALEILSEKLGVNGEDRALKVYDRLTFEDPIGRPAQIAADRQTADELSRQRDSAFAPLLKKWPALRWNQGEETDSGFESAADAAAQELTKDPALTAKILAAANAHDAASGELDNEEARLIRFADLCRSVVRARELREHGDPAIAERFRQLWEAEGAILPLKGAKP